jgi:NAD(P)-dependent dehydrogenase (short-subunit alcohol dehydrogenase family)
MMNSMMGKKSSEFEQRRIVIVGGSSGMGLATAQLLQSGGAEVIVVGRSEERLERARATLPPQPLVTIVPADMTTRAGRDAIVAHSAGVTDLVITAADLAYGPVADFTESNADKVVRSKLIAPFFLAQAFARILPANGSITFVSGIAAERPIRGGAWTGIVNAGLNAMVRGLAIELAPIRVNTVSPGWIDTPLWDQIRPDLAQREAMFADMRAKIPSRRIGRPEDVAHAIAATIGNGFMNASTLYVDGGQRLT